MTSALAIYGMFTNSAPLVAAVCDRRTFPWAEVARSERDECKGHVHGAKLATVIDRRSSVDCSAAQFVNRI